jgi:putative transposase
VVKVQPSLNRIDDFAAFLAAPFDEDAEYLALRRAETIGRPIGDDDWIKQLERDHGRKLTPCKRGRKPIERANTAGNDLFSKLSP